MIVPNIDDEQLARALCIAAKNHCKNTFALILKGTPHAVNYLTTPIALDSSYPLQLPVIYALQSLKRIEAIKENESNRVYREAQQRIAYEFTEMLINKTLDLLNATSHDHTTLLNLSAQWLSPNSWNDLKKENKENSVMDGNLNPRILRFTPDVIRKGTQGKPPMDNMDNDAHFLIKKVGPSC